MSAQRSERSGGRSGPHGSAGAPDLTAARKIVDDHRKGRMLVSCEVAYRVVESLVAAHAALRAQMECTTRLAEKLDFTDADIRDFTSQARLALGEVPEIYEAPRDLSIPLRVRGVGRVAEEPRALLLALNERPTDDEVRALHDHLAEVVIA
jgi:hypothetical protein